MLNMRNLVSLGICICLLAVQSPLYGGGLPWIKGLKKVGSSGRLSLGKSIRTQITRLTQKTGELRVSALERKYQSALFNKARRATFRALPKEESSLSNPFTGTTFWVQHKGKREIFGVVAAHTLQDMYITEGMLGREFNAVVVNGNIARTIPAQIVHFTPPSMGDLALVKFPASYERFLHPLELKEVELDLPAQGYLQGYAQNILTRQIFPIIGKTSQGSFVSQLPTAQLGERAGLCGSPVFTTDFQWAGIHVGSSYKTNSGYIVPVAVIEDLVKSYYHPQLQPQSIMLGDREIGRLAMDEYVVSLELLNINQRTLWKYDTQSKFSISAAQEKINQIPGVAFVRLTIGRAHWSDVNADAHIIYDGSFNSRVVTVPWVGK